MFPNTTRMTRVERTTMHAAAAVSETERMDISKEFEDPSNTEHKKVIFILRRYSSFFFLAWLNYQVIDIFFHSLGTNAVFKPR